MSDYAPILYRRALDWLPVDGAWRNEEGRYRAALSRLLRDHPALVEREYWQRPGRNPSISKSWAWRWRLTAEGIEAKRRKRVRDRAQELCRLVSGDPCRGPLAKCDASNCRAMAQASREIGP